MAGFTNFAFRHIVRSFGGAGLLATEMISARGFIYKDRRQEGYPDRLWGIETEPRPLAVQIWDNDPEVLAQVGLSGRADHYSNQLSGGQQQRVAIARALAMQPKAMLFDEPTSSLDPELTEEVLGVMRELARDGTTMIVVTHKMGFAREVSDRVMFLNDGLIEEEGPPQQLFGAPKSPRLRQFISKFLH